MILAAFVARLVQRIATTLGCQPGQLAMLRRAVHLSAVAAPADHENRFTPGATRFAPRLRLVLHSLAADATFSCLACEMRRGSAGRDTRRVQPGRELRLTPGLSLFSSSCLAPNGTEVGANPASSRPVPPDPGGRLQPSNRCANRPTCSPRSLARASSPSMLRIA